MKGDEGEFLTKQANDAQAAIKQTVNDMSKALGELADVRTWTKQYPWISVGAATAAGLVAALALTPKRRGKRVAEMSEDAKDKWQEIWEKIASKVGEPEDVAVVDEPAPKQKKASLLNGLLSHVMDIAKTALASGISASVAAHAPTDGQDGSKTYS